MTYRDFAQETFEQMLQMMENLFGTVGTSGNNYEKGDIEMWRINGYDVDSLYDEYQNLKAQYRKQSNVCAELKSNYEKLKDYNNDLKSKFEEQKRINDGLNKENVQLRERNSNLRGEIEEIYQNNNEQYDKLSQDKKELKKQNEELENRLADANKMRCSVAYQTASGQEYAGKQETLPLRKAQESLHEEYSAPQARISEAAKREDGLCAVQEEKKAQEDRENRTEELNQFSTERDDTIREYKSVQETVQQEKDELNQLRAERDNAIQQLKDMQTDAQKKADELVKQYLIPQQEELRNELEKERQTINKTNSNHAAELDEATQKAVQLVDDLKNDWRETMVESFEQMQEYQRKLDKELRNWKNSLYQRKYDLLASCYIEMYRIVNTNQLGVDILVEGVSDKMIQQVSEMNKSMSVILKKLEKAMQQINLHVYVPKCGEVYDDVLQAVVGCAGEPDPDAVVSECIAPGVLYYEGEDEQEGEPLVRALVKLSASRAEE